MLPFAEEPHAWCWRPPSVRRRVGFMCQWHPCQPYPICICVFVFVYLYICTTLPFAGEPHTWRWRPPASSVSGTLASISGRNSPQKGLGSTPQPFRVNTRSTKTEIHELAIFKEGALEWMKSYNFLKTCKIFWEFCSLPRVGFQLNGDEKGHLVLLTKVFTQAPHKAS